MRKAKVLVTDLSGENNKIWHHGDVVNEDCFPAGRFDQLIKGEFIKELEEEVAEEETQEEAPDESAETEKASTTKSKGKK